jgi:hypothetical protein
MQYFREFGLGEVIDHWRMMLVPMLLRAPKRGTLTGIRATIYGALVAKPIRFPDEIQMLIFPLRSEGQSHIGAGSQCRGSPGKGQGRPQPVTILRLEHRWLRHDHGKLDAAG